MVNVLCIVKSYHCNHISVEKLSARACRVIYCSIYMV
jgi:hypothetical protein